VLACGATATTSLVQVREPIKDRVHADADEFIYVVGGEGLLALPTQEMPLQAGTLALVPRGVTHALQRRGRGVLVLMTVLTDTPCSALKP
jgi:mannose-6-phosphate isomerase-like protein (cupin superfamily)